MLKLSISDQAREDLYDIWFYIAEDSPINADRFIDKITEKYQWLLEYPDAGVNREDLNKGLKSFPVGKYILYYRINDNVMELVRVLHSSRNTEKLFH